MFLRPFLILRTIFAFQLLMLVGFCDPPAVDYSTTEKEDPVEMDEEEDVEELGNVDEPEVSYDDPSVVTMGNTTLQILYVEYDVAAPENYVLSADNKTVMIEFMMKNEDDFMSLGVDRLDFYITNQWNVQYPVIRQMHNEYFRTAWINPGGITKGKIMLAAEKDAELTLHFRDLIYELDSFVAPTMTLKSNQTGLTDLSYKLGDIVETEYLSFQVIDVETDNGYREYTYYDYELVYVTLIAINNSDGAIYPAREDWFLGSRINDLSSTTYSVLWYNNPFVIEPGDKRMITYVFERPPGEEELVLLYNPESWYGSVYVEVEEPLEYITNVLDPKTSIDGYEQWFQLDSDDTRSYKITNISTDVDIAEVRIYFDIRNDTDETTEATTQPKVPGYMPRIYSATDSSVESRNNLGLYPNVSFTPYSLEPGEIAHEVNVFYAEESWDRVTSGHIYIKITHVDGEPEYLNLSR